LRLGKERKGGRGELSPPWGKKGKQMPESKGGGSHKRKKKKNTEYAQSPNHQLKPGRGGEGRFSL